MGKLVRDEMVGASRAGCPLARSKADVATQRPSPRAQHPGTLGSGRVRVNANGAEIVFEARLEIGACRRIQRPTRGVQHLANERGSLTHRTPRRIGTLGLDLVLLFALRALAADLRGRGQSHG